MSYHIQGTCSICGGAVGVPAAWFGVVPPVPSCMNCGAVPQRAYGPVIPMQKQPGVTVVPAETAGSFDIFKAMEQQIRRDTTA